MRKEPKSGLGPMTKLFAKFGGAIIAVEVAAFLGCWYTWRRLNKDQDFRLRAHHSFPWVLESYYALGETMDEKHKLIREYDRKVWMESGQYEK